MSLSLPRPCQGGCGHKHVTKHDHSGVPFVVCPGEVAQFGTEPFGDFCPENACIPPVCKVDWSFLTKQQPLVCPDLHEPCPGKCEKSRSGKPCGCGK